MTEPEGGRGAETGGTRQSTGPVEPARAGRWSAAGGGALLAAAIIVTPLWLVFLGWLVYRMALWLLN